MSAVGTRTTSSKDGNNKETKRRVTSGFTPRIYPRPVPKRTPFDVLTSGIVKSVRQPLVMTVLCVYVVFPLYAVVANW